MALMVLTDKLIKSLKDGEYIIGVYLDFSKAFDTDEHAILLSKLSHYGIRGNALNRFQSYSSNRKQYVTYNGVSSPVNNIVCGVPQGSILGPLLFLAATKQLYEWFSPSVRPSVRLSVRPSHLFDYVPIIASS